MKNLKLLVISVVFVVSITNVYAGSSFQNTCSNIEFDYMNNVATLKAVCLRTNGTSNSTSLEIRGISNNNGKLMQGSGSSSFQQSCGNIQITAKDTSNVILSAFCRTTSGGSNQTSISLNGISNQNGNLSYQVMIQGRDIRRDIIRCPDYPEPATFHHSVF